MTNIEVVKIFYENVISNNEEDRIKDFVSEHCQLKIGDKISVIGVDEMLEHLRATKSTYPDYKLKIIQQYTDGDYVISTFLMSGTHEGCFFGMNPTYKKLSFYGINIDKVIDGKITEHCGAVNTFETLWEANLIKANNNDK